MKLKDIDNIIEVAAKGFVDANNSIFITKRRWYSFWKKEEECLDIEVYIERMKKHFKSILDICIEKDTGLETRHTFFRIDTNKLAKTLKEKRK